MILNCVPALMVPTVITSGLRGSLKRLTSVCRFIIMLEAATMASLEYCGVLPWAETPCTVSTKLSQLAMRRPLVASMEPSGMPGHTCIP